MRVGQHGLGAAAFRRVVLLLAREPVAGRGDADRRGLRSRDHGIGPGVPRHGCFLRAAIIPQGLVETDHEPRQGRGVAEGVQAREPGHASLAIAGFVVRLGPEVENRHAQIGVALDRNEDGVAGSLRGAVAKRREAAEGQPHRRRWRSRTAAPELVEADVLALAAVCGGARGVRGRRQDDELGRRGRSGLERVERRRRRAARGWRDLPPTSGTCQGEDGDGVGALAADQDIEAARSACSPPRSHWAARESPPCACSTDATLRPLPCGTRRSTTPSARATTTCPFGRACAATHLLAGEDHAGAGRGVVQVEPHQVSAGRHGVAHAAVAREGGRLDHRAAQVEQRLRMPVVEEALADAGQQRSRCRCRR